MRKGLYYFVPGISLLLIAAAPIVGYFILRQFVSRGERQLDAVPLSPANYQLAMPELIRLCQSDPNFYNRESVACLDPFDPVWAPPTVVKLHPEMMDFNADGASVTWGGGFYHCGWELTRGTAIADGSAYVWTLSFFSEHEGRSKTLQTLTAGTDQKFTKDQFVTQALAEFDRRLAINADDGVYTNAESFLAAARCLFLTKQARVDLLPAEIRKSAASYPHDWRDVLLAYLLDHAANAAAAGDRLRRWADQTACPAAWVYAAYAFYQTHENVAGDDAIQKANTIKQAEPDWLDKDVPSYELGMALRLYRRGDFESCLKLCKAILSTPHRYFIILISVEHVCDWAAEPTSRPAELPEFDKYTVLDPFGGFDLSLLHLETTHAPISKSDN